MSKKKSNDFNNSPFKSLKGLSLSVKKEMTPPPPVASKEVLRNYDFVAEMEDLGVKVLPEDHRLPVVGIAKKVETTIPARPLVSARELNDEELFLQALEGMDRLFGDDNPGQQCTGNLTHRKK